MVLPMPCDSGLLLAPELAGAPLPSRHGLLDLTNQMGVPPSGFVQATAM